MERDKPSKHRRDFLKFLAGLGLGAGFAEVYERLYDIPSLQERFRKEVSYWINQYNTANEELKKNAKKISQLEDEVDSLNKVLSYQDELERESTSAISFYQQRMDKVIEGLRKTIEKYRVILGNERVSFESSSLKILEDLKITQEKLLKVLPYFPLIKSLDYNPSKVVNDKIYGLNVSLEVISPLNTLEEVEVRLIPVEYSHLPKEAFPEESIKTIKFKPKGLEREIFSCEFLDLKGGREYFIEAVAKDVAKNINKDKKKTPYIREFEKKSSDYLIGASYMTFWNVYWENSPAGRWKEVGVVYEPILGQYTSSDKSVINKDIDQATGHCIRFFSLDFGWIRPNSPFDKVAREYLLTSELANSINFTIFYHNDAVVGTTRSQGPRALYSDFSFLAENYFKHPSYLKVGNKMVVFLSNLPIYWKEFSVKETNNLFKDLKNYIKNKYGCELFLAVGIWPDADASFIDVPTLPFDGIFNWGNLWYNLNENEVEYDDYVDKYTEYWRKWSSLAESRGLQFIPLIYPGFDDKPYADYYGRTHHRIARNSERFRQFLRTAKEIATPHSKIILLFTYNDFHEGSSIAPTKEYDFTYLNLLTEVLYNEYNKP